MSKGIKKAIVLKGNWSILHLRKSLKGLKLKSATKDVSQILPGVPSVAGPCPRRGPMEAKTHPELKIFITKEGINLEAQVFTWGRHKEQK